MQSLLTIQILLTFWFSLLVLNCSSIHSENKEKENQVRLNDDEMAFYSSGSTFSPVVVLRADAIITWTWADSTTSNSSNPVKYYGSDQLRMNRLKVTPWSAVRRINIGYDGQDGGSHDFEMVENQHVTLVENLHLVAPFLKEWCSSYNKLTSLNFSNFTNLETIECYYSFLLENIQLINTPSLKRLCLEDNELNLIDLTDSDSIEDIRGALNNFSTIIFPTHPENIRHICVSNNPFKNPNLFNRMDHFPKIAQLWIAYTCQQGELVIPKSHDTEFVSIWAWNNRYSSLDLRGAYQNRNGNGYVNLSFNELTRVDITGCIQINELYLQNNLLESLAIDQILKQVDEFGTQNGIVDLRFNNPPTAVGLVYKANLEKRGWIVNTDQRIPVQSINISSEMGNTISTNKGTLQLKANILPFDATYQAVDWSVINVTGQASISSTGLLNAEKNGTVKAIAIAKDGSGQKGELEITVSGQNILIESIAIIDSDEENTIYGIGTKKSFQAVVLPENAHLKTINWAVENITGKAHIDNDGILITALQGLIKVIAQSTDGSNINSQKEYVIELPDPVKIIEKTDSFKVLTNSMEGVIQIRLSKIPVEQTIVEIRNLLGIKLLEQKIFNHETSLSIQHSIFNVYLVTLRNRNGASTQKVIF